MSEEKRQAKAACTVDMERQSLTFTFADPAKTVKTYAISDYPDEIVKQLALHGLEQKLRDCYASKELDAAAAIGAQAKVNDNLLAGLFNSKREGGSTVDSIGLLRQAIANVFGRLDPPQPIPAAWQDLDSMSKEARAELRSIKEFADELAVLRAAKRKPGATLGDVLAKLG